MQTPVQTTPQTKQTPLQTPCTHTPPYPLCACAALEGRSAGRMGGRERRRKGAPNRWTVPPRLIATGVSDQEFREEYARTQARASWASAPNPTEPDIAAGFCDQYALACMRLSWAPVGLLTFVSIGVGFRDQACASSLTFVAVSAGAPAKVFLTSHRACASWGLGPDGRRKPAQTHSRIHGTPSPSDAIGASAARFPFRLSGSGLASWGGARWNAFERPAAARRQLGRRGRRW